MKPLFIWFIASALISCGGNRLPQSVSDSSTDREQSQDAKVGTQEETDVNLYIKETPFFKACDHKLQLSKQDIDTIHEILLGLDAVDCSKATKKLILTSGLQFSRKKISHLNYFKGLVNVTNMDLSETLIQSLTGLEELTSLTSLSVSGTEVSDLTPLKNLKLLEWLNISGTKILDVSVLKDLPKLRTVILSTAVSADQIQILKEINPTLKILKDR